MNTDYTDHEYVKYTVENSRIVTWECECGANGPVDESTELRMKGYMAHLDTKILHTSSTTN